MKRLKIQLPKRFSTWKGSKRNLKKQFGQAIFGEVLDKAKDTHQRISRK